MRPPPAVLQKQAFGVLRTQDSQRQFLNDWSTMFLITGQRTGGMPALRMLNAAGAQPAAVTEVKCQRRARGSPAVPTAARAFLVLLLR